MTKRGSKPAKLPVQQLLILSICRIAEPIALTSVFPYIPEMMEYLGVRTEHVAFYAGLTTAIFSLCQCLTGVVWGRASDRFGRKPVILLGMTSTMLTSILFGFSRSIPWAMTMRAIAGLGNGNVGIIRTTVAEMVPQKELQPRAFSIMPLIWVIGSIFGPSFGGFFANPTRKWNWDNKFFERYPYLLPNLIASGIFSVGLATGVLFLHETLETRKNRKDYGRVLGARLTKSFIVAFKKAKRKYTDAEAAPLLGSPSSSSTAIDGGVNGKASPDDEDPQSTEPPGYSEVFRRQSCINLLVYCLLALHSVAFDQLLPIFMHHPLQNHKDNSDVQLPFKFAGGFGLDSNGIGLIFTCYGVFGMLGQFLVFPPMARKIGILNCLKVCSVAFPVLYVLAPYTALFETNKSRQAAVLVLMAFKSLVTVHAFPSSTILLTNSASSLRILGTLNGVATSVSAVGRAAGPAIGGSTFSLGVDRGFVLVPFWTIAAFAIVGAVPVWWLVESEGFGDAESDSGSEDGEDDDEGEDDDDDDDDNDQESAENDESAGQPVGRPRPALRSRSMAAPNDEEAIEDEDEVPPEPLARVPSAGQRPGPGVLSRRRSQAALSRTVSNPIGIRGSLGSGNVRRLSTNLGSTNNGLGPGGTSWH